MPESGRGSRGPLLAVGLAALALMAVGTFVPRPADPDWLFGLDRYRDLPLPVFFGAAALLLALLIGHRPADAVARAAASLGRVPPALGGALVVAGAGLAFLLLPNYHASGDAGQVAHFVALGQVYPSNALTDYLFAATSRLLGLEPVVAIRLVSALAGMVYAGSAVAIGRECFAPGCRRVGLTAMLLTTGTVALFFGTIEVYAPVVAALSVYLLLGIRWLHGKGRGIAPPICLGIAFALHGLAGLLLPSLIVLANRGRLVPRATGRAALFGLLFLLPVAIVFAGLWLGTWSGEPPEAGSARTGTFFGVQDQAPLLPLRHSPDEPRRRYALLDLEHTVGVANLLLLVAMPGILLLAARRRKRAEAEGSPVVGFLAVAALFLVLFPVFWNISYDLRTDWDLFSAAGVPLALLGGLAFFSGRSTAVDAVRATAISVFCLLPVVVSNHTRESLRYVYAKDMCTACRVAVPTMIAKEAVGHLLDGPGGDAQGPPERGPRVWRADLELFAIGLLMQGGAIRPTGVGEVLDGVVPVLEEEAERAGRNHGLEPASASVARILAEELGREVRRIRGAGRPEPPVEVVASRTAGQALARRDLRAALRGGPGEATLEVYLLDVLDAALARRGAWVQAEPRLDAAALRAMARRGFAATFAGLEADLNADLWGDLLTDSLMETLGDARAGRRWRRLLAAQTKWEHRWRECRPAGEAEALQRAERLYSEGDLERAERFISHWQERAPDESKWLDLLGGVFLAQGRGEEGQALLRRAIERDPHLLVARVRLANELIANGRLEEAEPILARGLHLSGLRSWATSALFQLAWLRVQKGETDDAVAMLRLTLIILDRKTPSPESAALRRRVEALIQEASGR